jgi:protein phosphatase
LPGGGHILICSDGLWNVVPEEAISEIITGTPDPQQACKQLIDAANAAGGPDNITTILIRLPD